MVTREPQISQAIYTWALKLISGQQGFGFAAVSPALSSRLDWLEASTKALTGFVGNLDTAADVRRSYAPTGRHVAGDQTLAYRKQDAGRDGHGRSGNYVVQFLVAPASLFGLTDVLRIPNAAWIEPAQVQPKGQPPYLKDLLLADFRASLTDCKLDAVDVRSMRLLLEELAEAGSANISGWTDQELLTLLSVMPAWFDYSVTLVPRWTQAGAERHLQVMPGVQWAGLVEDHRLEPPTSELQDTRRMLLSTIDIREILAQLSVSASDPSRASTPHVPARHISHRRTDSHSPTATASGAEEREPDAVADSVRKWVTGASRELTSAERQVLQRDPHETLRALHRTKLQIPPTRKPDPLALSLLERCDDVDAEFLTQILPVDDEAVASYVAFCNHTALLEAAVLLNSDRSRAIDISFQTSVGAETLHGLVQLAKADSRLFDGLVRSLRISSQRSGSFARRLLLAKGVDYGYLYTTLIPAASEGRDEALLCLAFINPEEFVHWLDVPATYEGALINALRQETRDKAWERISRFASRWRRR